MCRVSSYRRPPAAKGISLIPPHTKPTPATLDVPATRPKHEIDRRDSNDTHTTVASHESHVAALDTIDVENLAETMESDMGFTEVDSDFLKVPEGGIISLPREHLDDDHQNNTTPTSPKVSSILDTKLPAKIGPKKSTKDLHVFTKPPPQEGDKGWDYFTPAVSYDQEAYLTPTCTFKPIKSPPPTPTHRRCVLEFSSFPEYLFLPSL